MKFRTGSIAFTAALLLAACGGEDHAVLVSGRGIRVTDDDFHLEFQRLLPDDQVRVLQPGGKLELVTRLAYREMLLAEAEAAELPDMEAWLKISEDLWLARLWLEAELDRLYETDLDTGWIDSMMSVEVTVSAVLMRDSLAALEVLESWQSDGPSEPAAGMALAPWSRGGSSYFEFQGSCFLLYAGNPLFARTVAAHAGEGSVAVPAFGAMAVVRADTAGTAVPDYDIQTVAKYFISSRLAVERDVTVISGAVEQLADHFSLIDGEYFFTDTQELDSLLRVAEFPGGTVTAGDVVTAARLVSDRNFFNGVPEDFLPLMLPRPMLDPEIDLWVFVEGMAEISRQADLARQAGIEWPEAKRQLTVTDQALKSRVIDETAEADTSVALDFYRENSHLYHIPELRSIVVAYVPFEWMPDGEVSSFSDLERYYSRTDPDGDLIATDPCPMELYGGYGEEVFGARTGVFTGPVRYPGDEVFVFFEVVEVIPAGADDPMLIMPILMEDCRRAMMHRRLEDYLLELWNYYSIEIDSGLVRELDPWEHAY